MRHRVFGKKLNRTRNQRQALLKGLMRSFFIHGKIKTTYSKAQFVRPSLEKVINIAKKNDLIAHRRIFALFQDRRLTSAIVKAVSSSVGDKSSSFTKIKKIKIRRGDQSLVVEILPTFPLLPAVPILSKKKASEDKKDKKGKKKPSDKKKAKPVKKEKVTKKIKEK